MSDTLLNIREVPILKPRRLTSRDAAESTDMVKPAAARQGSQQPRAGKTTVYQRCLAVHMYFAGPRSALSCD